MNVRVQGVSAGVVTYQVGVEIDDLTIATTNIGIRQKGTTAHNRLQGETHVGADSAPTTVLQVTGDFITTQVSQAYASPSTVTVTSSNSFKIAAASASYTINASGPGTAGQYLFIQWSADSGGARTVTYGTNFKSSGTQGSGGASKTATSLWISDGSAWWEVARQNNLA
jgi:hypothetical protein